MYTHAYLYTYMHTYTLIHKTDTFLPYFNIFVNFAYLFEMCYFELIYFADKKGYCIDVI